MLRAWLTAVLFASAAWAQSAPPLQPLARSALIAVDAVAVPEGLSLRVRRLSGPEPLAVSDVSVSIDGKSAAASLRADGSWFAPRPAGVSTAGATINVTVGHDGIHELLSGRLAGSAAPPAAAPSSSSRAGHGQLAWWVLNIVIVLIAAIAISRRMS